MLTATIRVSAKSAAKNKSLYTLYFILYTPTPMRLPFALLALAGALTVSAQLTAESAFTSAPAEVFPLLERNSRLDMIDYFRSGLDTPTANRLDGGSRVTALSDSKMDLNLSDASSAQIVLLPAGSDTIIAVVNTLAMPGKDSSVSFYSSQWKKLSGENIFKAPIMDDWMTKGHSTREVTDVTPFMIASITIDPAAGSLTVNNNLSAFLAPEVYESIAPAMLPQLTYKWDGRRFRPAR